MARFTVIITSFNRPNILERNLEFLLSFKNKCKIIIADSSKNIFDNVSLKNLIIKNKILFKHFSEDTFFSKKVFEISKFIDTKYCVLVPDDDFISLSAVKNCINFLDKNPTYSSCHGKYFSHVQKKLLGKKQIYFEDKTKNLISAEEDLYSRVRRYMAGELLSQYTLYAVHRTLDFKSIWKETAQHANNWVIHEYFSTIMSLSKGKMKTLPIFYMSREPNYFVPINYMLRKKILNKKNNLKIAKVLSKKINLKVKNKQRIEEEIFKYLETKRQNSKKKEQNIKYLNKNKNFLKANYIFYLFKKFLFNNDELLNSKCIDKIRNIVIKFEDNIGEIENSRKIV